MTPADSVTDVPADSLPVWCGPLAAAGGTRRCPTAPRGCGRLAAAWRGAL